MYEFHEVANIFPLIDGTELDTLARDISENGLIEAIWLHPDGRIVDGRNRYRACKKANVKPEFRYWDESKHGPLLEFVLSLNLHRRHMDKGQLAFVALEVEPLLAERAKERQAQNALNNSPFVDGDSNKEIIPDSSKGQARDQAAALVGTNGRYVQDAKTLQAEAPDLATQVKRGSKSLPKAKKEMKKRQRVEKESKAIEVRSSYNLFCSDIATLDIPDDSIDFIITDPPYPLEYIDTYLELSRLAARVLKPGGSLLAMAGQSYLTEVTKRLDACMTYQWTLAYLTPGGQAVQVWPRKVNTFWKPVFWYVKGEYAGRWIGDVSKSAVNDNDKEFHHWGQSISGMTDLIGRITEPGCTILDPFCGGGATGAAALSMGRHFIGSDIDSECIDTCMDRFKVFVCNNGKTA